MREDSASKEPYYVRLPRWPNFELTNNNIDGRVPVCQIENWQAFEKLISEEPDKLKEGARIYRGHRRFDWQLAATLTREFNGGAISVPLAVKLLNRFRLAMRGRGVDLNGNDDNEIWAFGQHFGLATPLLDWTESPFVALFFAFEKEDDAAEIQNDSRAIFSLNRGLVEELLPDLFFEPALGENSRLVNQAGLFTVTPPGDDNLVSAIIDSVIDSGSVSPDNAGEIARYIFKVHIPNQGRRECLSMLRRMNIHHANLFPDPSGASFYSNDWLRREIVEEKRIKAAQAELASKPKAVVPQLPEEGRPDILGERGNIANILTLLLVQQDEITPLTINEWASKIGTVYEETAALDWPAHQSTYNQVRIRLKRLLAALGFPADRRDQALDHIVDYYRSEYTKRHGIENLVVS
jgi:hypothetical protein